MLSLERLPHDNPHISDPCLAPRNSKWTQLKVNTAMEVPKNFGSQIKLTIMITMVLVDPLIR